MRSQPHWLRAKEGTENRHQGGVGLRKPNMVGPVGCYPEQGPGGGEVAVPTSPLRVNPLPSPRPSGHTRPLCTQIVGLQPHLQVSLTSACSAGQTHLEPTSPFCPPTPSSTEGPGAPSMHTGSPSPPVVWAKCTFWQLEGGKGRGQTFWLL